MDFTRYLIGLAALMGFMLLSLLCAHVLFRWGINSQYRRKKPVQAGPVE
ncbi:hypothetical protein QFZ23_004772 [Arthrobacter globiformis]|nr:hypothetical protein [Arthrobacter globiformis]MDQ1060807.1 hypothetical protein [Arthrobacter globiformis]